MIVFQTHNDTLSAEKERARTATSAPQWDRLFYGNFVINIAGKEFGNVDCGLSLTSAFLAGVRRIMFSGSKLQRITFLESHHTVGIQVASDSDNIQLSASESSDNLFGPNSIVSEQISAIAFSNAVADEFVRLFLEASKAYERFDFNQQNSHLLKWVNE